jgi:hypothetical protein
VHPERRSRGRVATNACRGRLRFIPPAVDEQQQRRRRGTAAAAAAAAAAVRETALCFWHTRVAHASQFGHAPSPTRNALSVTLGRDESKSPIPRLRFITSQSVAGRKTPRRCHVHTTTVVTRRHHSVQNLQPRATVGDKARISGKISHGQAGEPPTLRRDSGGQPPGFLGRLAQPLRQRSRQRPAPHLPAPASPRAGRVVHPGLAAQPEYVLSLDHRHPGRR